MTRSPRFKGLLEVAAEVRASIPNRGTLHYDLRAGASIYGIYALYILMVEGYVHPMLFVPIGFVMFIRYFVNYHMHFHADRQIGPRSLWSTAIPMIVGPLQLGYPEYRKNHHIHHNLEGKAGDPDLFITSQKTFWGGAFHSFFESEQALPRYIMEHGLNWKLAARSLLYMSLWFAMAWYGGEKFLWYVLMTRAGSFFSWMVFAWFLHRHERFSAHRENFMPRWVRSVYGTIFGEDCLIGTLNHYTHHEYGFLPDERLREAVAIIDRRERA